ncbi:hypothetical protein SAMN06265375_102523 [Muriicola jejuensis]|uniref:Uncharacterized protein n=1 Tax=Muriicola jejuensis TaxID=504488 RepID=A0A6P0UD36_9FLAO|nr:hypothetical protein [Muriicola jejuensis]NER10502.1 hypothetical protein [Muriicola jejuensis]SMP18488.1 hypothetical protein SAMN06265375_102523 [Muriicola jejuensis]
MKYILTTLFIILFITTSSAQTTGRIDGGAGAAFGIGGRGTTDPFLAKHMTSLRKNDNGFDGNILGSPYLTDDFIKSKIYFGEDYIGDYYIRYNALNSEIEIKETSLPEEEPKRLLANENVRVKYGSRELRFTTYINKKGETKNGFLSIIEQGKNFTLYQRLAVKYSEGKTAVNSMVNDIPSRYAHFVEYYYQKEGVERIDQLATKKSAVLRILEKDERENVGDFLKDERIDLDEEKGLIRTFEYINTLDTES